MALTSSNYLNAWSCLWGNWIYLFLFSRSDFLLVSDRPEGAAVIQHAWVWGLMLRWCRPDRRLSWSERFRSWRTPPRKTHSCVSAFPRCPPRCRTRRCCTGSQVGGDIGLTSDIFYDVVIVVLLFLATFARHNVNDTCWISEQSQIGSCTRIFDIWRISDSSDIKKIYTCKWAFRCYYFFNFVRID